MSYSRARRITLTGDPNEGIGPPKRYTKGLARRQLFALLQKNLLLKSRSKLVLLCEIMSPLVFMMVLVLGWSIADSNIIHTGAKIYTNQTDAVQAVLDAFGTRNIDPTFFSGCNGQVCSYCMDPPYDCFEFDLSASAVQETMFNIGKDYSGPIPVLNLSQFLALRSVLFGGSTKTIDDIQKNMRFSNALFRSADLFSQLKNLGKLFFCPDTREVRRFVDHLNSTTPGLFPEHFGGIFNADVDAIEEIMDAKNGLPSLKRTWALMNFKKLDFRQREVDFEIRMNSTVIPNTGSVLTNLSSRPQLFNSDYLQYTASGFLSLQHAVDSYLLDEAPFSPYFEKPVMTAPFPTTAFDENPFFWNVGHTTGFIIALSFIYPLASMIKSIVEDKETRTKETMNMMGLKSWVFWATWYSTYVGIAFCTSFIGTVIMTHTVYQHMSPMIFFTFMFTYALSIISLGLLCSVFFARASLAPIFACLILVTMCAPNLMFWYRNPNEFVILRRIVAFLSPTAFEMYGKKLVFSERSSTSLVLGSLKMDYQDPTELLLYLIFDNVLYLSLAWYFSHVWPSRYGRRLPWNFLFTKKFWFKPPVLQRKMSLIREPGNARFDLESNDPNVEAPPSRLEGNESIRIDKLSKQFIFGFGQHRTTTQAVDELSLKMYPGQITALLGHNGAGKTTTINMLSGLLEPSSGECYVNGYRVKSEMQQIRESMGVCPQFNVLFADLTVFEHLKLYAVLKGVEPCLVAPMALQLVEDVGLAQKRDALARSLTGGMKRKLQVAIAVIGPSKIIFLDEPTSGMDPYSRHFTWDLLKRYKKGRTIILTSHFMDEADLLGDRIAILSAGKLKCCGSSLFLKSRYGIGYTMTMVQDSTPSNELCKVVRRFIPTAQKMDNSSGELTFRLPLSATKDFPELFNHLETHREELSLHGYGISMTTLEEVFMRIAQVEEELATHVGEQSDFDDQADSGFGDMSEGEENSHHIALDIDGASHAEGTGLHSEGSGSPDEGAASLSRQSSVGEGADWGPRNTASITSGESAPLFIPRRRRMTKSALPRTRSTWKQLTTMIWKRWVCAGRDINGRIMEILLPVVAVAFAMLILHVDLKVPRPPMRLDARLFQTVPGSSSSVLNKPYGGDGKGITDIIHTKSLDPDILYYFKNDSHSNLMCFNETSSTGLSKRLLEHDNYYTHENSRFGGYVNSDVLFADTSIRVQDQTLPFQYLSDITVMFNSSSPHSPPVFLAELTKAKLAAKFKDTTPKYTLSNKPLPESHSFQVLRQSMVTTFAALFVLLPFCYLPASFTSFIVRERSSKAKHIQLVSGMNKTVYWVATYIWDMANYLFVLLCTMGIFEAYGNSEFVGSFDVFMGTFSLMFAAGFAMMSKAYLLTFMFESDLVSQVSIAVINSVFGFGLCVFSFVLDMIDTTVDLNNNLKMVFRLFPQYCMGEGLINLGMRPYQNVMFGRDDGGFAWEVTSRNIVYLVCEAVVFFTLVLMKEWDFDWYSLLPKRRQLSTTSDLENEIIMRQILSMPKDLDEDVSKERIRVLSGKVDDSLLNIRHLTKIYPPKESGGTAVRAVRDICLHIPRGQCFGFLGVNGAGKTTTMQILTGDAQASYGSATIGGYSISEDIDKVRQIIGYCPQFDPLLDRMTGEEHLTMFAHLRGIHADLIPAEVENLIHRLKLEPAAKKITSTYCGGDKRKLSLAIALIGNPSLVILDEPSTGMDPVSRRFMWDVISSLTDQMSVILTSHLMEECEALCARVCIMTSGQLQCIGTLQHLKNRFGKGYRLEISGAEHRSEDIHDFIKNSFPGAVLEEFLGGRFIYHLPRDRTESVSLAEIFSSIEAHKKNLSIRDYSVSQSTLEQIFINVAKQFEIRNEMDVTDLESVNEDARSGAFGDDIGPAESIEDPGRRLSA
eukprot:806033_1